MAVNNNQIDIINGDSAAGTFKYAFKKDNDDLLIFHDVLSCGPVGKYSGLDAWKKARESFWLVSVPDDQFDLRPRDFYSHFFSVDPVSRINLWIGASLSDQLLLAFVVHLFLINDLDFDRLFIYQFETSSSDKGKTYRVTGLGQLHPDVMSKHPEPFNLNDQQISYANAAWESYTDAKPEAYMRFMADPDIHLPLLKNAMSYIHFRYPDKTTGLNYFDQLLLKNAINHGPKVNHVIGYSMADLMDGLDWVGDDFLFHRLKSKSNQFMDEPLYLISPNNKPMRDSEIKVTEFGQLVFERKASFIDTNGIDDWIGGVHLNSKNRCVWVRDDKKLIEITSDQNFL